MRSRPGDRMREHVSWTDSVHAAIVNMMEDGTGPPNVGARTALDDEAQVTLPRSAASSVDLLRARRSLPHGSPRLPGIHRCGQAALQSTASG